LGPNNAGKSSLKLFFYEMRGLFEVFLRGTDMNPSLLSGISGSAIGVGGYPGTSDFAEIFNNSNDRDLSFEIEVVDPTVRSDAHHTVHRLVASCRRASPLQWQVEVHSIQSPRNPVFSSTGYKPADHFRFSDGAGVILYDFRDLLEIVQAFYGARYYGAFRNALNQGSAQYYDFQIGTAFIDLWNSWKTSGIKSHSRAIGK